MPSTLSTLASTCVSARPSDDTPSPARRCCRRILCGLLCPNRLDEPLPEDLRLWPSNWVPLACAVHALGPILGPIWPVAPIAYRYYGHFLDIEVFHKGRPALVVADNNVGIWVLGLGAARTLRLASRAPSRFATTPAAALCIGTSRALRRFPPQGQATLAAAESALVPPALRPGQSGRPWPAAPCCRAWADHEAAHCVFSLCPRIVVTKKNPARGFLCFFLFFYLFLDYPLGN